MSGARKVTGRLVQPPQLRPSLPGVLAWRWCTGAPLGGPEQGEAAPHRRSRRAAWRHGITLAVLLAAAEALTDLAALAVIAVAGTAAGGWLGWLWWRQRPHARDYLRTAYERLRSHGLPMEGGIDRHLEIPEDRERARYYLPRDWDAPAGALEQAEKAISRTLGWGEESAVTRHLSGRRRFIDLVPPPLPPPATAVLAHPKIQAAIRNAAPWEVVLGLGRAEAVVKFKMIGENARPHGLANGPTTEAGKSATARLLNAQWMRHGGVSVILDPAWLSHPWASTFKDGDLPNAIVVRTVEDIAAMLVWLKETMDARLMVALAGQRRSGLVEADLGPKMLVTLEEMNSLILDLKDYPEAVEALLKLVCRGRHMGIHALCLSQRAEARTLAGKYGGQVREQLGWKLCGRGTSPATLKFLAEGLPYPPGGITGPEGRYGAVIGREWVDVQVAFGTNEECWDLAVSRPEMIAELPHGMPAVMGSGMEAVPATATGAIGAQPGKTQASPVAVAPAEPLASLQEYAVLRGESWSRLHAKRHRWRGKGWPEVAAVDAHNKSAELFTIRELDEFLQAGGR